MKKVGIVTFHNAHNYGAVLQTYALQNTIKSRGKNRDVYVIDYYNNYVYWQYKVIAPFRKNIFKWFKIVINNIKHYNNRKQRYISFDNFINKYFNLTKRYNDNNILKETFDFTHMVTGSDQVWSIATVGCLSNVYTLNFGNSNIKRISYAASVGNTDDVRNNKEEFKDKLSSLDCISVREENAQKELKKVINRDVVVTLDPTLLLSRSEWDEVVSNVNTLESEKYILAYVVEADDNYVNIVNDLSEKTGLRVIHFGCGNPGFKDVLKSAYTEGPLEFVSYIKNADYVVTTSFHATIFSIIYNKKFFVVPHKKTGARVTNLLDKLGLKERVFNKFEDFKKIDYDFESNWIDVNKKLRSEKEKSLKWLDDAIDL